MPKTVNPTRLTLPQKKRLEEMPDDVKIVAWGELLRGPILKFTTGKTYIVTRDGGLSPVEDSK